MLSPAQIDGATAAFIAGLITSPHCVGMCGPIGCAALPLGRSETSLTWAMASYHLTRALAYTCFGALAGALGSDLVDFLGARPTRVLPWLMVALLLLVAFRLDRYLPKFQAWHGLFFRLNARLRRLPRWSVGAGLGALTPLLPCGPLYLVLTVALFSGSLLKGAEIGLGFALGTIPLLWLAQTGFFHARERFSPAILRWTQLGFALAAAALIAWRMIASGGEFGDQFCH